MGGLLGERGGRAGAWRLRSLSAIAAVGLIAFVVSAPGARAGFEPTLALSLDSTATDSPTGIGFLLDLSPESEAGAVELQRAALTLPRGLSLDPSALPSLASCSPAQAGLTSAVGVTPPAFDAAPAQCPTASEVGSVEIRSPLVAQPLLGSVYLATQGANPFGSLLAVYVAAEEPLTGVRLEFAGKLVPDPQSGQLTILFEEIPRLPVQAVRLELAGGPRGVLTTPSICGSFPVEAELTPWEGAETRLLTQLGIGEGAGGSACPGSEASEPNQPAFEAGTLDPAAGADSPFFLHLRREAGSQPLAGFDITLPPGLLGHLGGVAICGDSAIATAQARGGEGGGAVEEASPSCPAASQLGTISVASGSGAPVEVLGRIYLAGPYRGAPLSVVSITPAIVGPLDLGVVVDRVATYVNPTTAQIEPVTNTIPTIIHGITLDIRSIAAELDRPGFTLNPTHCGPLASTGTTTSVLDQSTPISSPFQASGCAALPFAPKLRLRLEGGTRRHRFPALDAILTAKPGEANSARASVLLPHSEFVEQGHVRTVCTRVQFAARECPPGSVYGHARVFTPLLDVPEEGPVYMRSSSHELPDLVVLLRGPASQPIEIELDARIDSVRGRNRSTFEVIPDAPITRFVLHLQGGRKGLLVNSTNLCTAPKSDRRATVRLTGQNGKRYDTTPLVRNSCQRGAGAGTTLPACARSRSLGAWPGSASGSAARRSRSSSSTCSGSRSTSGSKNCSTSSGRSRPGRSPRGWCCRARRRGWRRWPGSGSCGRRRSGRG